MKSYVLTREQEIGRSLEDCFAFYANARNLEKLTPAFLNFRILTTNVERIKAGTLIDYRLALFGVPFHWTTLIEIWEPGKRFVDRQLTGPYSEWIHTHSFEAVGEERTVVKDMVEYRIPFGVLGRIAHSLFVKRTLGKIFDYRAEVTRRLLTTPEGRL